MKKKPEESPKIFAVFHSFEEENEAEYRRRALMTPEERLSEFGRIQTRVWGKKWTKEPMKKIAFAEWVNWDSEQ